MPLGQLSGIGGLPSCHVKGNVAASANPKQGASPSPRLATVLYPSPPATPHFLPTPVCAWIHDLSSTPFRPMRNATTSLLRHRRATLNLTRPPHALLLSGGTLLNLHSTFHFPYFWSIDLRIWMWVILLRRLICSSTLIAGEDEEESKKQRK